MTRWVLLAIAVALLVVGFAFNLVQAGSNAQPWGQSLFDNFLLARTLPFVIGLGIAVGLARAQAWRSEPGVRSDGAVRRFAPSTVLLHWLATVAVLVGLATGAWQYLKGLLDVGSPISMPLVYRFHYLAAMLLLFCLAVFVTDWLVRRERGLTVPGGQWIRHLRGLAHELPRPLGVMLGYVIGLDMRRAPPPQEQFTYYERVISFPTWVIALTLIVVTGVLKAMRYVYPIPGDVLYWASAIHVGAMVLLAIKLLDHVRYVIAPSRWSLFVAMLTGWTRTGPSRSSDPAPTPQPVSSVRSKEAV
jgi:hypothetical protein